MYYVSNVEFIAVTKGGGKFRQVGVEVPSVYSSLSNHWCNISANSPLVQEVIEFSLENKEELIRNQGWGHGLHAKGIPENSTLPQCVGYSENWQQSDDTVN